MYLIKEYKTNSITILFVLLAVIEGVSLHALEIIGLNAVSLLNGLSITTFYVSMAVVMSSIFIGYLIFILVEKAVLGTRVLLFIFVVAGSYYFLLSVFSEYLDSILAGNFFLSLLIYLGFPIIILGASPFFILKSATNLINLQFNSKIISYYFSLSTISGVLFIVMISILDFGNFNNNDFFRFFSLMFIGVFFSLNLIFDKNIVIFVSSLILVILLFFIPNITYNSQFDDGNILFKKQSIQGEVKIVDEFEIINPNYTRHKRLLYHNNNTQSTVDLKTGNSLYSYVHMMSYLCSDKKKSSNVLLLGTGGGSTIKELSQQEFNIDVVEINKYIANAIDDYFIEKVDYNMFIDDARHHINKSNKKYDIILLDIINGKSIPYHMYTYEAFDKMKRMLSDEGKLIIHFSGPYRGKKSNGLISVLKTVNKVFNTKAELYSQLYDFNGWKVINVTKNKNGNKTKKVNINNCCFDFYPKYELIDYKEIDWKKGVVLQDDKNLLEIYYNQMLSN